MARQGSGGWNKFLNFIGLVDDEGSREKYGDEYRDGNYGRQSAYTPGRQRGQAGGRGASYGRGTGRSSRQGQSDTRRDLENARSRYGGGSRYDSGSSRVSSVRTPSGYDDYSNSGRRPASRFDDADYDYSDRPQSRFSEGGSNLPERVPPRGHVSKRSRTVMYSLHSLEDCCEVIDQLIANNTVVLSMDDLDGHLMQRAVDTLSGAVFALHASIRKASQSGKTYLLAPDSVDVDGSW